MFCNVVIRLQGIRQVGAPSGVHFGIVAPTVLSHIQSVEVFLTALQRIR